MAPVEPNTDVPVLNATLPLLVADTVVGADCSDSCPLPPAPAPVVTYTGPPIADDAPAEIVTAPPVPVLPEPTVT